MENEEKDIFSLITNIKNSMKNLNILISSNENNTIEQKIHTPTQSHSTKPETIFNLDELDKSKASALFLLLNLDYTAKNIELKDLTVTKEPSYNPQYPILFTLNASVRTSKDIDFSEIVKDLVDAEERMAKIKNSNSSDLNNKIEQLFGTFPK
jgi:hypothetical protein